MDRADRSKVHLDISINNSEFSCLPLPRASLTFAVFLSEAPNGSFFDGYPVFKLGDFGLAFETDRLAGRDTWRDAVMRIPARRAPVIPPFTIFSEEANYDLEGNGRCL